jgi:hypothetical protein
MPPTKLGWMVFVQRSRLVIRNNHRVTTGSANVLGLLPPPPASRDTSSSFSKPRRSSSIG